MNTRSHRFALAALLVLAALPVASAQGILIGANEVGIGIGDVPRMTGLRLNFRDRDLERVNGVNVTIWSPYDDARRSSVRGVAIGLPVTGAGDIEGMAITAIGFGVKNHFRGIGVAPIAMGAGGDMEGLMLAGVGIGGGRNLTGVGITGVGIGTGGHIKGLMIGGVGIGSGGGIEGIALGGVGVGGGGDIRGIAAGGVGVGGGGSAKGIVAGGIGVGMGGDVTGLALGGIGVGVGGTLRGVGIGGIGVGAPRIHGVAVSGIAGGVQDLRGVAVSGAWFKLNKGELRGVSVASYNEIRGVQRGWTIGLVNLAEELHGVQVGLVNIAFNNPSGRKVLPIVNWHE